MKVQEKIAHFKNRRLALLVDDSGPLVRGVLVSPAQEIGFEQVNQLISYSGGLVFVAISPSRASAFMLPAMDRSDAQQANPTSTYKMFISVEAREGVATGISTADRKCTISILGEATPNPRKLVRPGHIFPVETVTGGTLVKHALPEGALDLATKAGFSDAAAFVDVLDAQGAFPKLPELEKLASDLNLPQIFLSDLVRYRLETEELVHRVAEARLPTEEAGMLKSVAYRSELYYGEHVALIKGEIDPNQSVLVRVQRESTCSDVFGGEDPASRSQISGALRAIEERGTGVLVYLRGNQRGQLAAQISGKKDHTNANPSGMLREYGIGAQILRDLGVKRIDLLTSSKKSLVGLKTFGIEIVSQKVI